MFQEDELTLILVGAVLGGVVGWGQYAWDQKARKVNTNGRPDATQDGATDGNQ